MKQHLEISIRGKVQGVGFRFEAKECADKLGVRGYARNLRDGSVFLEIEAEDNQLTSFIDWCKSYEILAKVESMDIHEGEIKGFRGFQIY